MARLWAASRTYPSPERGGSVGEADRGGAVATAGLLRDGTGSTCRVGKAKRAHHARAVSSRCDIVEGSVGNGEGAVAHPTGSAPAATTPPDLATLGHPPPSRGQALP